MFQMFLFCCLFTFATPPATALRSAPTISLGLEIDRPSVCSVKSTIEITWGVNKGVRRLSIEENNFPHECRFCIHFVRNFIETTAPSCYRYDQQQSTAIEGLTSGAYQVQGHFETESCGGEGNVPPKTTKTARFEVRDCVYAEDGTELFVLKGGVDGGTYSSNTTLLLTAGNSSNHHQMHAFLDNEFMSVLTPKEMFMDQPGLHVLNITVMTLTTPTTFTTFTFTFVISTNAEEWGLLPFSPRPEQSFPRADTGLQQPLLFVLAPSVFMFNSPLPVVFVVKNGLTNDTVWLTTGKDVVRLGYQTFVNSTWTYVPINIYRGYGSIVLPPNVSALHVFTLDKDLLRVATPSVRINAIKPNSMRTDGDTIHCHRGVALVLRSFVLSNNTQHFHCSGNTTILFARQTSIQIESGSTIRLIGMNHLQPITLSALKPAASWGGIRITGSASSLHARWAIIALSGTGDPGHAFKHGHRPETPAILLVEGGHLHLEDCFLIRGGQAFGAASNNNNVPTRSSVLLNRVLVQGFTTGGQWDDANVEILSSHFGQFGEIKDDYDVLKAPVNGDSDGIYIGGSHSTLFMKNSVVRAAGDDCIDAGSSNGGRIELEGCLIESCRHEGLAFSNDIGTLAKQFRVRNTIIRDCQQGVELGCSTSSTHVQLDHSVVVDCLVGIRLGDNNVNCNAAGTIAIEQSTIVNCETATLRLHRGDDQTKRWTPSGALQVLDTLNVQPTHDATVKTSAFVRKHLDNTFRLLPDTKGYKAAVDGHSNGLIENMYASMFRTFDTDLGSKNSDALVSVVVTSPREGECVLTTDGNAVVRVELMDSTFDGYIHISVNGYLVQTGTSRIEAGRTHGAVNLFEIELQLQEQFNVIVAEVYRDDGSGNDRSPTRVARTVSTFCYNAAPVAVYHDKYIKQRIETMFGMQQPQWQDTCDIDTNMNTNTFRVMQFNQSTVHVSFGFSQPLTTFDIEMYHIGRSIQRCGRQSFKVNVLDKSQEKKQEMIPSSFLLLAICGGPLPLLAYESSITILSSYYDLYPSAHGLVLVSGLDDSGSTTKKHQLYLMVESVVTAIQHLLPRSVALQSVMQRTNVGTLREYMGPPDNDRIFQEARRKHKTALVSYEEANPGVETSTTGFTFDASTTATETTSSSTPATLRTPLVSVARLVRDLPPGSALLRTSLQSEINMTQYVGLLAFNSLILNSDIQDEIFFYSTASTSSKKDARPLRLGIIGWDFDDVLGKCTSMSTSFRDPLLYCAQSALDGAVATDSVMRIELRRHLTTLINTALSPQMHRRAANQTSTQICAVINVAAEHNVVLDLGIDVTCKDVKQAENQLVETIDLRRAFLKNRIEIEEEEVQKKHMGGETKQDKTNGAPMYDRCTVTGKTQRSSIETNQSRKRLLSAPIASISILGVAQAGTDEEQNNIDKYPKGLVVFEDGSRAVLKLLERQEALSQVLAVAIDRVLDIGRVPTSVHRRLTLQEQSMLPKALGRYELFLNPTQLVVVSLVEWLDGICDSSKMCGTTMFSNEFYFRSNHLSYRKAHDEKHSLSLNIGTLDQRVQWTVQGIFDYILGSSDRCMVVGGDDHPFLNMTGWHVLDEYQKLMPDLRQCQNVHFQRMMNATHPELMLMDHDKSWLTGSNVRLIHRSHGCEYPLELSKTLLDFIEPTEIQQLYKRQRAGVPLSQRIMDDLIEMYANGWYALKYLQVEGIFWDPEEIDGGLNLTSLIDGQVQKLVDHMESCVDRYGVHRVMCVSKKY